MDGRHGWCVRCCEKKLKRCGRGNKARTQNVWERHARHRTRAQPARTNVRPVASSTPRGKGAYGIRYRKEDDAFDLGEGAGGSHPSNCSKPNDVAVFDYPARAAGKFCRTTPSKITTPVPHGLASPPLPSPSLDVLEMRLLGPAVPCDNGSCFAVRDR